MRLGAAMATGLGSFANFEAEPFPPREVTLMCAGSLTPSQGAYP
jgi:hypothetical protein